MTGAQTAMELVRQCWGNRPLTRAETQQLRSAGSLGGHLASALPLLTFELEKSSQRLAALHGIDPAGVEFQQLDPDLGTAYSLDQPYISTNPRLRLTCSEAQRAQQGSQQPNWPQPAWVRLKQHCAIRVPAMSAFGNIRTDVVEVVEKELRTLVEWTSSGDGNTTIPPYPLQEQRGEDGEATALALAMHRELADSWEVHQCLVRERTPQVGANARKVIEQSQV